MAHRDPFRKLPHRPSDYGAADAAAGRSVDPSMGGSEADPQVGRSTDLPDGDGAGSPAAPTPLEQFRAPRQRRPIHPLEQALLWLVSAHLVFLPWALGTMHVWAQAVSVMLSAVSLILALVPRSYTEQLTGGAAFRLISWPKLLRFPIFWLGLALLGLIAVQALNPAWVWFTNGKAWWMVGAPHTTWLPSGVRVPFDMWGPWRMLMIYASAWLTVCAIWVGFTRRRTIQRLFLVIAVNGVALSGLGLAERLTGTTKIFWSYTPSNGAFFGSFIYKNHAGGYLDLVLSVTCGLAAWYFVRGARRLEKSNPSGVFAFLATCIAVSVLVSYARGATLVMMGYLFVVVAAFVWFQWRLPAAARRPIVAIAMLLVFGFFLKTGLEALHSDLAWDRLAHALGGNDLSVEARETANHASFDMLKDKWPLGSGSGSFRFLFPFYQQHYPTIWQDEGHQLWWEHAHNDILEIPIELGLPGLLIIIAAFGYWAFALVRAYAWQNPLSASIILGCLFLLGMSWGEFVFENPAILITWCALWPACTIWAELEEQRRA